MLFIRNSTRYFEVLKIEKKKVVTFRKKHASNTFYVLRATCDEKVTSYKESFRVTVKKKREDAVQNRDQNLFQKNRMFECLK